MTENRGVMHMLALLFFARAELEELQRKRADVSGYPEDALRHEIRQKLFRELHAEFLRESERPTS